MIGVSLAEAAPRLRKNQCLLGIDYGSKMIGIAVSDPSLIVASPLTTIARKRFSEDAAKLVALIVERNVGGLIVGLPKNLDGREGPMAQAARTFVRNLEKMGKLPDPDIPVVFWDERFSTAAVQRLLIEDDMTRKRRGEVVDKMAAAYILQGALDAMRRVGV